MVDRLAVIDVDDNDMRILVTRLEYGDVVHAVDTVAGINGDSMDPGDKQLTLRPRLLEDIPATDGTPDWGGRVHFGGGGWWWG